ncbi:MAG: cytochrome c maturation protein CcmE [Myxococcales bacterium]|nr:cytochrome c maturation protein CcmE [Myxococcales bacterium]
MSDADFRPEDGHEEGAPSTGNRLMASRLRFLVGTLVAVGALIYVAFSSFESEVYFLTVAEVSDQQENIGGREFRLKGIVVPGSHMVSETALHEHWFTLHEEDETRQVFFAGALPDTFADEAEVVALGRLRDDGVFEAVEVVAKCPSRYEEAAPTATTASNP